MRLISFNVLVGSLLLASAAAIAQTTTAPGSAAPATNTGGMGWLWIVLLLVIVGAAVWYFAFARNKSGGCDLTRRSHFHKSPDWFDLRCDRHDSYRNQLHGY